MTSLRSTRFRFAAGLRCLSWIWLNMAWNCVELSPLAEPQTSFLYWTNLGQLDSSENSPSSPHRVGQEWTSRSITVEFPVREWILSWNLKEEIPIQLSLLIPRSNHVASEFTMGRWSTSTNQYERTSVSQTPTEDGEVQTDTLVLKRPSREVRIRITSPVTRSLASCVSLLALSGLGGDGAWSSPIRSPPQSPFECEVPIYSQAEYPDGIDKWCSPTSATMLAAYWDRQFHKEVRWSVPEVARAVFDPGWPGTGNWAFNAAFLGANPDLHSAVARLPNLQALESLLRRGWPVAASVSLQMLNGQPQARTGDGHLVVVRGLTDSGDILINDPGRARHRVPREIRRAAFERAWAHSQHTVYLVWPEKEKLDPW